MPDSRANAERRVLRFESLDDIVRDAERRAHDGARVTGSWPPGRIVQHIADAINGSIDGWDVRAPDDVRARARERLPHILREGIEPGIRVPQPLQSILPREGVTCEEALDNLREAVARAETASMNADHPFLGPLTDSEWRTLHCRHAELHLSFVM